MVITGEQLNCGSGIKIDELVPLIANPPTESFTGEEFTMPKTLPGGKELIDNEALRVMWFLDTDRLIQAIDKTMKLTTDTEKSLKLAVALMQWTFIGSEPTWPRSIYRGMSAAGQPRHEYFRAKQKRDVNKITQHQRQALELVLECEKVWYVPHNLLEAYGLPADPNEIRILLGMEPIEYPDEPEELEPSTPAETEDESAIVGCLPD